MGLVADIYGMSVNEAMSLSQREVDYLLDQAQFTFFNMATSSPAMQEIVRARLEPTVRAVREARESSDRSEGGGGIGAPPNR